MTSSASAHRAARPAPRSGQVRAGGGILCCQRSSRNVTPGTVSGLKATRCSCHKVIGAAPARSLEPGIARHLHNAHSVNVRPARRPVRSAPSAPASTREFLIVNILIFMHTHILRTERLQQHRPAESMENDITSNFICRRSNSLH